MKKIALFTAAFVFILLLTEIANQIPTAAAIARPRRINAPGDSSDLIQVLSLTP